MIRFNSIKSAKIAASNENDEARHYAITATIEVNEGKAVNVSEGRVKTLSADAEIASFTGWNEKALNCNMHNVEEEEQETVFAAIRTFVKNLRSEGETLKLESLI